MYTDVIGDDVGDWGKQIHGLTAPTKSRPHDTGVPARLQFQGVKRSSQNFPVYRPIAD